MYGNGHVAGDHCLLFPGGDMVIPLHTRPPRTAPFPPGLEPQLVREDKDSNSEIMCLAVVRDIPCNPYVSPGTII